MKNNILLNVCCMLLIFLFIYTAGSKLTSLRETYFEMDSQPFPNWATPYIVWTTSLAELGISALLLFKNTMRIGLIGALILMILFTGYVGAILLGFFSRVPCSCGGVIKDLGWTGHLIFNLSFLGICIWGLKLSNREIPKAKQLTKPAYNTV